MENEFLDMINANRRLIFKVCHLYAFEKGLIDDLYQEIILQLWRSFPSFRRESKTSTWVYRVSLNTAIGEFRREIRKPKQTSLSSLHLELPDSDALQDERLKTLNDAIRKISPIDRALLMLYLEEKSYQDISEILGITVSNVGVKLNRLKTKLEQIIKKEEYESR